ncbi:MAG TPA: drug/metabolite exporter YedA [Chloroflexia bacterium]|nr:drug/metabolite exporter YedA [Chloroflexia bacterium]
MARPSVAGATPLRTGLALLTLYIIWGSTYFAIKVALEGFPPFLMAGARFLVAGVGMYAFLRLRGIPNPRRAEWRGAAIVGILLLATGNGGVVFAEQWIGSGLAALGVATVPVWAALFAGLWGQWPSGREWAGIVLGLVGMVLLNLESDLRANPIGAVAVLAAAASWALGSVWSRRLSLPPGAMASSAEMLAGGGVLMLASLLTGEHIAAVPGPRPLLAVAYLVVFGSIVAFSAYGYLLRYTRPAVATSYAYANPLVAVLLGVTFAGEHISLSGILAMVVILAGVGLVTIRRVRPAPAVAVAPDEPAPEPSVGELVETGRR